MLIFTDFQEENSRHEGWRTRTQIGHENLTCCNEESVDVLSWQSGVGGDRLHPRLAHGTQSSESYSGAKPCRHLYTVVHNLKEVI